jgi:hypothetical protein
MTFGLALIDGAKERFDQFSKGKANFFFHFWGSYGCQWLHYEKNGMICN